MRRLPLAPPPLPDEAISSWIARIASRYDLSPYALAKHLLPREDGYGEMLRWIDVRSAAPLEAAFAAATRRSKAEFEARRLPGLVGDPQKAWPRRASVWCPRCLIGSLKQFGEVYARREWGFGGYLICPKHKRLLTNACPRCGRQAGYRPVAGRLRLWCSPCSACADAMPELHGIGTWPPRAQPAARACRAVTMTPQARALLLEVQGDLLLLLGGGSPRGSWTASLENERISHILRDFSFVMLGPLGEAPYRAAPGPNRKQIEEPPPDDWHPGVLPPDVVAPVLMACVTFLAGDGEDPLAGVTWDPRILADGEGRSINTETLLWHLTAGEGETLRKMFASPPVQQFLPLLSILTGSPIVLPARHEAKRRRWTLWARGGWTRANSPPSGWRRGWEAGYRPSSPYALNRFSPLTVPVEPSATSNQTLHRAAAAVYMALGTDPTDNDADPSKYAGTLFGNRYIHFWLLRHLHLHPDRLTEILAKAVDVSQATDRGVVLPEIPQEGMSTGAVPMSQTTGAVEKG